MTSHHVYSWSDQMLYVREVILDGDHVTSVLRSFLISRNVVGVILNVLYVMKQQSKLLMQHRCLDITGWRRSGWVSQNHPFWGCVYIEVECNEVPEVWLCSETTCAITTNYLMRKHASVPTHVVKLRDLISPEVSLGQKIESHDYTQT